MTAGGYESDYFGKRNQDKASRAWFLLPFFLGVIGGIIGIIVLWNKDRETAKWLLIMGFVFSFMWFLLLTFIGLWGMANTTGPAGYTAV